MINKILPFIIVLTVLASCSDAPLLIEEQTLDQNVIAACKDKPCPQVTVAYITYNGEPEVITSINEEIRQFVIASLYLGDPESQPTATTSQEAMAQFIKDYWRDTSEFPDINEYEADITVAETFRSQELATVALNQYTYAGGAHGNGSLTYINFDIETGEIITNDQLIQDKKGLVKLAEQQLRKDYKLNETENLNATIFWFESDSFSLSDNIGFEKGKMVIHYNQYEIASYADGAIDIELSIEDVAPFLKYSLKK